MSKSVSVIITDDLDGSGNAETVLFVNAARKLVLAQFP
jgi:hypothetical protein